MALQIWLPLNGNLNSQGLTNVTLSSGTPTYTAGKIGQCLSTGSLTFNVPSSLITSLGSTNVYSMCCWCKILDTTSSARWVFQVGTGTGTSRGLWENNATASRHWAYSGSGINISTSINTVDLNWHHICFTSSGSTVKMYIDGVYQNQSTTASTTAMTGSTLYLNATSYNLNDFRLYDHTLSADEVKQISKGLVAHYTLSRFGQDNLFIGTGMTATDRTGLVTNSSTDWTKYFRIYNGSTSIHSFSATNGVVEDTITLNSAANLGICFVRKATDISLDSTQYYTLSCEAKTTKSGASLAIGLSYYNTSNSWVWRGGTNTKAFSATNTWQTFTLTFKPDADTQYICYCFTVVGVASGTDTWTIRKCKLEEGSIATPWIPNSADALYSAMKLNDNTEYDISGYQNNGIKNDPNLIYSSDTVRFDVSTMNSQGQDSDVYPLKGNIALNDIDTITISMWAKPSANGKQGSGFLCTSANSVPTDYQATVMNQYDNKIACTNTSGTVVNLTVSNQFTLNEWHHYAFVYDGTKAYFYKDGTLVTSATQTGKLKPITAIFPFYSKAGGLSRVSSGKMSDLRVYATALSADDILKLYHGIE